MSQIVNCKVVILGNSSTGKSSIASRYVTDSFDEMSEPTIGASFFKKDIHTNEGTISFEIWDTAGQERYKSLAPMYYRNAKIALVVFDITNKESFLGAIKWIKELKENCANIIIALLGNKHDLPNHFDKYIINEYVDSHNLIYYETSAKENYNISNVFKNLADEFCLLNENNNTTNSVEITDFNIQSKKKNNCC